MLIRWNAAKAMVGHVVMLVMALLFAGGLASIWAAEPLTGSVDVIDGDTLQIGGVLVQLDGIDAPELGQTCLHGGKRWRCGLEAAFALKRSVVVGQVVCLPQGRDSPKILALCTRDRVDLADEMLRRGYGVALHDAAPNYLRAQEAARRARLGLWRSQFVRPWDWRRGVRIPGGEAGAAVVCDVKGTTNIRSERVFYLPSDKGYDSIVIDPAKGDRMFCSDDEALLGGWKHIPLR